MKARTRDFVAWSRARTASAAPKNRVRRSQGAVFPSAGGFAASTLRIDSMIARPLQGGVEVRTGLTEVYAVAILNLTGVVRWKGFNVGFRPAVSPHQGPREVRGPAAPRPEGRGGLARAQLRGHAASRPRRLAAAHPRCRRPGRGGRRGAV